MVFSYLGGVFKILTLAFFVDLPQINKTGQNRPVFPGDLHVDVLVSEIVSC